MHIENTDPLLTDKESASFLSISVPTFRRHVAKGKFPKAVKVGGASRWPRSEILSIIETLKQARQSAA